MWTLLLFLPLLLGAKEIDLEWLIRKPTSTAKDYYIWRYLQQRITPDEADIAIREAQNVNRKLFLTYAKRASREIQRIAHCMQIGAKELLKVDPSCAAAGVSVAKLSTLSKREVAAVLKRLEGFQVPQSASLLLKGKRELSPTQFMTLFNLSSSSYRKKMDRSFKREEMAEMSRKRWAFRSFVRKIVFSNRYPKLAASILLTPPEKLDAQTAFFLALQGIKSHLPYTAIDYLKHSARKAYYQDQIDRAHFWLYRLTGKREYLQKLADSWDLNFYSLYGKERTFTPIDYVVYEAHGKKNIDLRDPFVWHFFLQQAPYLKKEDFFYENTLALYAFLAQRESRYHLHPFILPYKELMRGYSPERKALIYAIARQESHFIPGAVSRSFALGLMQFMPFLAKHTAKELNVKNFDLDMMFDPAVAIPFANHHLNYLESRLQDPLLIAYAYNGGIGFVKRKVLPLFKRYDPLLAMELVPYAESREYGKKVLANYYIYSRILKRPFTLQDYLERLDGRFHNRGGRG
ncbi:MAG: lytic transglycosylase domain-containing protein [Epsilonproteobacteria bacterium]|nr:hypothetical protein [Campylobacterota bacterium]NPA57250.1 lytic transglycosylase domain-containing protein [Campylobacterota bacterium]